MSDKIQLVWANTRHLIIKPMWPRTKLWLQSLKQFLIICLGASLICVLVPSLILMVLKHMSHLMTKPTKWLCAQRTLRSESSLHAQWVAKELSFLHADSEDCDQTGRMPRMIWVFAGRTCQFCWLCREAAHMTNRRWDVSGRKLFSL